MTAPVLADGGPATPSAKAARQTIAQVAADFNTDIENGLQQSQIESLLGLHGPNDFETKEEESLLVKFYKSFAENPLILLLLGSAVVSLLMRQMDDAISITLVKLQTLIFGLRAPPTKLILLSFRLLSLL